MAYSFDQWITSLKPHKVGHTTHLIDTISDKEFGFIWEFGPLTILKIDGWYNERLRVIKIFEREFTW